MYIHAHTLEHTHMHTSSIYYTHINTHLHIFFITQIIIIIIIIGIRNIYRSRFSFFICTYKIILSCVFVIIYICVCVCVCIFAHVYVCVYKSVRTEYPKHDCSMHDYLI